MDAAQKKRVTDELEEAARKVFAYKSPAKSEKAERRGRGRHRKSLSVKEEPETRYNKEEEG